MTEEIEEIAYDYLIVGSGPVGSAYARAISERFPHRTILMVDLGAQVSARPGTNAKNIFLYNYNEDGLDSLSEIVRGELTPTSWPVQQPWPEGLNPIAQPTPDNPPVKYALNGGNPDQEDWDNMPAGASSFNVGGMGGHWTCCTPRPTPAERIKFIPEPEWVRLIEEAEGILQTNQVSFLKSLRGQVARNALAQAFDAHLPLGRKVQMLPLACKRTSSDWVEWTGADTVLGPLAEPGASGRKFTLLAETICRKILYANREEGDEITVTGAMIEHLPTRTRRKVKASTVIVAANSFYTPQLLWESQIRPAALGHYLNDQPMLFCQVVLSHKLLDEIRHLNPNHPPQDPIPIPKNDPIPQVWIPFSDEHPFHCQIHRDSFPYSILPENAGVDHRTIIELRWFTRKHITREDRITFSDKHKDMYGMPQITFHYTYNKTDQATINAAFDDMTKAAATLGGYLPGREPKVLPRGSSLHYMGTFRMGEHDDGTSVCDANSKVWNFKNLYLGGNGIIPTATACNPTLTSVALALKACNSLT